MNLYQQKKTIYFENLDGLRFICFLLVFFFHSFHTEYNFIKSNYIYEFITDFIFENGNLGVNIFFVLSGFLITFLLILEKRNSGHINIKKFWIRRIFRIWPLFFFCIFFGFIVFPEVKSFFGESPNETANLIYYLSFINNFDIIKNGLPDSSVLGVLWSIAIEEQFYLIWPIILSFFSIKRYWIPFLIIIVINIIFRSFNHDYINLEFHTISCIGDMTVGAIGAWLVSNFSRFKFFITNLSKTKIYFLYIMFFVFYLFRKEISSISLIILIIERLLIACLIILIILEQNYSKNSFYKFSSFKTISNLGKITYGLYCLHFIGILIVITITDKLNINNNLWEVLILETCLALIISIFISKISYNYFEKPFLKIKAKFN